MYGLKPGVLSTYAGPHAVTQLKKAGVVVGEYQYDANGNQTSGGGRTIDYTSFNMPKRIATATSVVEFAYDGAHERITQVKDGEQTLYLSPRWDTGIQFLKTSKKDGSTEYQHHIYAASTPVAVYTATVTGTTVAKKTRYFHKDHLGSITAITDETGNTVERFSFDPFGARRQSGAFNNLTPRETRHGYTGHEMLDSVNLVHMNGRIYDPKLGRFLQADPTIDGMRNPQGYNRYAYVQNNPLGATDPGGYKAFWKKKWFKKAIVTIAVVALVAYTGGVAYNAAYWAMAAETSSIASISIGAGMMGGLASGATMGAAIGYSQTHSLKGTIKGAARGGVTGMMSGAIGGGISALTANSGFLTQALGKGVTSGISSTLGGGKFADGFRMGAITATAAATYEAAVGYAADPNPGEGVVAKPDGTGPVKGKINFGNDRTAEKIMNNPDLGWLEEGGTVSKFANGLSTGNSIGGIHDTIQVKIASFGQMIGGNVGASVAHGSTNVFTMVPAATFNAYAVMYENPAAMGVYASSR